MTARIGVVVFPGSNCEQDVVTALEYLGANPSYVWHHETNLDRYDVVVLPGGFAYGDYLRTGAIAAFSPVLDAVRSFAGKGGPVIGVCNGFQVLCEAGLLPGALRKNSGLKFKCVPVHVRVETTNAPFLNEANVGSVLQIPINHFEGNYFCSPTVLERLRAEDRVAMRYCDVAGRITDASNPNGALDSIAGVLSEDRNVLGLMPHPERAVDPEVGGIDGQVILKSALKTLVR